MLTKWISQQPLCCKRLQPSKRNDEFRAVWEALEPAQRQTIETLGQDNDEVDDEQQAAA
eukprot:m.44817 g.44817  ORF g.44817 m.44817 type:complete len:59 (+) comp11736_c0_seq2:3730-3906(+)